MRGGFDLYGNYYPNANDALNAEMAQRNEIDNSINQIKLREIEQKIQEPPDLYFQIQELFARVKALEKEVNELKRKESKS